MKLDHRKGRRQALFWQHPKLYMQRPWKWSSQPQYPPPPKQHYSPKNPDSRSHWQDKGRLTRLLPRYPLYLRTEEKSNSKATPTSLRTRRGIYSMKKLHLPPDNTITLFGGLTESQNRVKICYNTSCAADEYTKSITGSIIPFHLYLILPGSFILHPFSLLLYKYFTQNTIEKLKQTSITAE